jgi:hypothetical protein
VHLKTFANLKNAEQYRWGVPFREKAIEILPWKVSPQKTWYRVMVGEGSKAIKEMNLQ